MTPRPSTIPLLAAPFYFLRHGETESNVRDTVAGSLDVALTARGIEQAQVAARALTRSGITAIYSSGLRRAQDTARIVAAALGLGVTIVPGLAERCWGVLEGEPRSARVPGLTPAGAETPEEFENRVLNAFAAVASVGLPLIVAHSGVFRVLCRALGRPVPAERVANALPVLCRPPDEASPVWRIEPIA